MPFDVEILNDITGQVSANIRRAVKQAEREQADAVAEHMVQSIVAGRKSGRIYTRKPKGRYQASAPGEAPANVTGDLAEGISVERHENSSVVVSRSKISHTMEFGTAGGKIAPRPFAMPAAVQGEKEFPARVEAAVRSVTG